MFNDLLEKIYRSSAKLLVKLLYDLEFEGFENIPEEGPAIVVANHVSYVDGLILNAASKRKMRFIIDEDIYRRPVINYFMKMDRAIPIKPRKDSVEKALKKAAQALQAGEIIMIFPEGQITYTGYMIRFKFGVEWILKRQPVPVIPIALVGLWGSIFSRKYIHNKWRFMPRYFRMKVKVLCGRPIEPEKASINNLQKTIMHMKSNAISELPDKS